MCKSTSNFFFLCVCYVSFRKIEEKILCWYCAILCTSMQSWQSICGMCTWCTHLHVQINVYGLIYVYILVNLFIDMIILHCAKFHFLFSLFYFSIAYRRIRILIFMFCGICVANTSIFITYDAKQFKKVFPNIYSSTQTAE